MKSMVTVAITGLMLVSCAVKSSAVSVPSISARLPAESVEAIKEKLHEFGECNANICFAIDGSTAMNEEMFTNQKNFVLDVASIVGVDEPAELAAVQYADTRKVTMGLTTDSAAFTLAVNDDTQLGGGSGTAEGIALCTTQLSQRPGEANKIVLLSDGVTSTGRNALWRAELFRWRGGELSVVAAGDVNEEQISALAGFQEDRIFKVSSFLDVLQLQDIIEKMVLEVCANNDGKPISPGEWRGGRAWGTAR